MKEEIKNNTNGMKEEMEKMRGEMQNMGHGLQAGKMATPRAATNELEGSAPAGEDRAIRETSRTRHEVTEKRKLNGVTETCTAGREVTELTCTREIEERLHNTDGVVGRAHTHTHR